MKKLVGFIGITILLLSLSVTVFAGSVPEDLLHHDGAQVFFGEVIAYSKNAENPHVSVCPVKKIKGDIITGSKQSYSEATPVGDIKIKPGNVYLFTYFDENNPTYIFEATSYDTQTLKLKNVTGDMWERFENYLNEGKYEKAERERMDKVNDAGTEEGEKISLTALLGVEKDKCDKIEFSPSGAQSYAIDKEEFFKLADEIYLKDVANTLAGTSDSFFITAYEGNAVHTVNMWDNCKVSGSRTAMHSAPMGDYAIRAADYEKLVALFPPEAQPDLPKLKSLYANFVYWFIYNATTVYVIGALLIMVLTSAIGFVIGYKIRKKKARRETL